DRAMERVRARLELLRADDGDLGAVALDGLALEQRLLTVGAGGVGGDVVRTRRDRVGVLERELLALVDGVVGAVISPDHLRRDDLVRPRDGGRKDDGERRDP